MVKELENKISESVKHFKESLAVIRSGRPSPKLLEDIQADYFGQKMPIKQLGSISIAPPREIQVSVWDKQAVVAASKAIEAANLGVSVNIDGNLIRVNLPALSTERRQELIKVAKKETEEARIKIRHLRDEANKKISSKEEAGEISEDDKFKFKEEIQKAVDKANKEIDEILANKTKEIEE
ncbi:MAG: Ribosome-recycling factor [Candidatus Wolfebacteria bacterium GW2011_GWC1_37_10]|uniref:Ribosome-recycling factor n=1 Tax=Candidatus Wolfebacteria bacterium GW2011_GWC1_37_10 TaxID=1619010 RepID=A0A0G0FTG8_9BACT|nr:MAG: Ribosome-recycling factor [Candidatus Wolfebacteria bacterium GW2011_GWC1_37_10]